MGDDRARRNYGLGCQRRSGGEEHGVVLVYVCQNKTHQLVLGYCVMVSPNRPHLKANASIHTAASDMQMNSNEYFNQSQINC